MLSIDIDQSEILRAYLLKGFRVAAVRGVQSTAARVVQRIVADVIPSTVDSVTGKGPPVDRGAYRAGWRMKPTMKGADIVNTVPYAGIIEYGARAGNIKVGRRMIDALASWVRRKGMVAKRADARGVAWAIATRMKQRGIFSGGKGLRVLERAIKNLDRTLLKEIGAEIEKEFAK